MAISDWLARRWSEQSGGSPGTVKHDSLPRKLRVQICHIGTECLGEYPAVNRSYMDDAIVYVYQYITRLIVQEAGVIKLEELYPTKNSYDTLCESLWNAVLDIKDIPILLSIIETLFRSVPDIQRDSHQYYFENCNRRMEAADDLNARFRQHNVGYQFVNNQIIRVDSQWIQQEAMQPALSLLSEKRFENANSEFMDAHSHYKKGEYRDCIIDCGIAFESVMKIICKKQGWVFEKRDTAATLVRTCIKNKLMPSFWENYGNNLSNILTSAIPTSRNKMAHGGGDVEVKADLHSATFIMHLTASTIIFLIEAEKALKK